MTADIYIGDGGVGRCDGCLADDVPLDNIVRDCYLCGHCQAAPRRAADAIEARAGDDVFTGWYQDVADRLRRYGRNGTNATL